MFFFCLQAGWDAELAEDAEFAAALSQLLREQPHRFSGGEETAVDTSIGDLAEEVETMDEAPGPSHRLTEKEMVCLEKKSSILNDYSAVFPFDTFFFSSKIDNAAS